MFVQKYIFPLLLFVPVAAVQLFVVPLITFDGIGPDLVVIIVIYFTLLYGQFYGTILGFVIGALFDVISGGIIGSSMFAKTLTAFAVGYFYDENKLEQNTGTLLLVFIVFIGALINSFFFALLGTQEITLSLTFIVFDISLLPAVYTAVFSFPLIIFKRQPRIE
jgi:rod shape-determining protein MreD